MYHITSLNSEQNKILTTVIVNKCQEDEKIAWVFRYYYDMHMATYQGKKQQSVNSRAVLKQ